jgi:hypothetical protein
MRFIEIANADDQLALWRLISDNVWSAVMAQAKEQARLKAQAAANPKPKKINPKKRLFRKSHQPQSQNRQHLSHPHRKVRYPSR